MTRIVFCEDDLAIQKLIRVSMRTTPYEIHLAADGREGLDLIQQVRPALVFTDVAMPAVNGYELADALRSDPALSRIPVIFMTASAQRGQREEAFGHGAAGFIAKPFSPAELRAKVAELLNGTSGIAGG